MKRFDGGPAFPGVFHNFGETNLLAPNGELVPPRSSINMHGMSLLQLYAKDAPPVPDWFNPPRRTAKPRLPDPKTLPVDEREVFNALRNGTIMEENASVPALTFYRSWTKAQKQLDDWSNAGDSERFFAWRWYFAQQMLSGPPKELGEVNDE